ncbi:MAG: hypothetical protein ACRDT6_09540 [Micromonosporaceae bacterium]
MTYIDNGPSYWHTLLIAVIGGIVAVLVVDGWAWLVEWWARRQETRWEWQPLTGTGDTTADDPDAAAGTPAPLHGTWTPPLLWAANGRYVHRHDCDHMTTGEPIKVWTEDGARKWAESETPRLTGCPRCDPFGKPNGQSGSPPRPVDELDRELTRERFGKGR